MSQRETCRGKPNEKRTVRYLGTHSAGCKAPGEIFAPNDGGNGKPMKVSEQVTEGMREVV